MIYSTPPDAKTVKFAKSSDGLTLAIGAVAAYSLPLDIDAQSVRLCSTVACHVGIFTDAAITVSATGGKNIYLPANTPEYFMLPTASAATGSGVAPATNNELQTPRVLVGAVVGVITAVGGSTGDLHITPCL